MGALHPVSGPVTAATTAELTRSVRETLEGAAGAGFELIHLKCFNGTRCDAAFGLTPYLLEMSYRIQALQSVPTCWELTGFRVTRPVPELRSVRTHFRCCSCLQLGPPIVRTQPSRN